MTTPSQQHPVAGQDADLRQRLRSSLASPHCAAPDGLQDRVLAQWRMRYPELQATGGGALALTRGAWLSRRVQWGLLAGVVVLAGVTAQVHHQQSQRAMDDLLEADVLSLIAAGEL